MKLTARTTATGVTANNTFIHIVNTNDTTQDPAGSSYKAPLSLLSPIFTGATIDSYTDNVTLSGNTLQFDNNIYGSNFYNVDISPILTGATDSYTDGVTLSGSTLQFDNNIYGSNFYSVDLATILTGGTTDSYTDNATLVGNTLQFDNNILGANFYSVDLSAIVSTPFTGNTSGDCINELHVVRLYGCPELNIMTDVIIDGDLTTENLDVNDTLHTNDLEVGGSLSVDGPTILQGVTFNLTGGTEGDVLTIDSGGNAVWEEPCCSGSTSGSTFGIFGISNSLGEYTYYSTLQSALDSAVTGDTVQVFANYEETSNTSVVLKDQVDINFNGYTYSLTSSGSGNTLTDNNTIVNTKLYNGTIYRAGASYVSDTQNLCLEVLNSQTVIENNGVYYSTSATTAINNTGTVSGAIVRAGTINEFNPCNCVVNSGVLKDVDAYLFYGTAAILAQNGTSEIINCKGEIGYAGYGILAVSTVIGGQVLRDSVGIANNGVGIYALGQFQCQNNIGYSNTAYGLQAFESIIESCKGYSNTDRGLYLDDVLSANNCQGWSFGGNGTYIDTTGTIESEISSLLSESWGDTATICFLNGSGLLSLRNIVSSCNIPGANSHSVQVIGTSTRPMEILGGVLSTYTGGSSGTCLDHNTATPASTESIGYANVSFRRSGGGTAISPGIVQNFVTTVDSQGNMINV